VSLEDKQSLTSKETRKARRSLTQELEEKGVANADVVADNLADMGIVDNLSTYLPLIKHDQGSRIIQMVYELSGLKRGTQNINTAAAKAAKVVFALKNYSHGGISGEKVLSSITEGIDTVLTLYFNQLKQGIEVIRNFEEIEKIMCYPDELNQVWTNLIQNAIQAMENKGVLKIDVKRVKDGIKVLITDSGKGIPQENQDKIFEPFFTTKRAGEGTGLGLDIVSKIVKKHDGRIFVASEPGNTTFTVYLPITNNKNNTIMQIDRGKE
jgi:signal transduction histidine kinase